MDPVDSWDTDDFRSMGRSASGLDVDDLELLGKNYSMPSDQVAFHLYRPEFKCHSDQS